MVLLDQSVGNLRMMCEGTAKEDQGDTAGGHIFTAHIRFDVGVGGSAIRRGTMFS